jgi:hypothetical protein
MKRGLFLVFVMGLGLTNVAWAQPWISGFVEGAQALRIQHNSALDSSRSLSDREYPRSEVRVQLQLSGGGDRDEYFVRVDFLSDQLSSEVGQLDLREAYLKLFPADWFDLKIGRQVATWGTGDLLFVNDLFAKDFVAFVTGLDIGYLKLPQDLLRMAFYLGKPTLEIAVSPYYTMDNVPAGKRLSVYNPATGELVNSEGTLPTETQPTDLGHGEIFARLYGMSGNVEWAFYGYRGFYPQPVGLKIVDSMPVLFPPRLSSGGASLRGPLAGFLVHAEGALYYSEEDSDGTDPMLPNSTIRAIAGAERSLGNELTASAQWFGEYMLGFDDYRTHFDTTMLTPLQRALEQSVTVRLTKFYKNQTLKFTLFSFWGITAEDVYVRAIADYNITDPVNLTFGINWLDGNHPYTLFGQLQNNSNVYGRIRYSF